tara:strand:+ start:2139 stop:2342 length:204 start_codon:yes stop_codon:yes gene_type:complete
MALHEATYSVETEEVTIGTNTFDHGKYWRTQEGITDTVGMWDDEAELFIPNGYFEQISGYIKIDDKG